MTISQRTLKYIAYISMFIDHLAILLQRNMLVGITGYYVMRGVGRLAFPLFLYFLVVGAAHTRSMPRYVGRLAALAIISEIPYDMYFYKGFPNWEHQNIFFELLLCLILITLLERTLPCNREELSETNFCPAYIVFFTAVMCIPAYFLHFSYGFKGIIATAFMYLYYRERSKALRIVYLVCSALALIVISTKIQIACVAVIPLIFLSNTDEQRQSKAVQIFFYLFYPVHIMLLYFIGQSL